MLFHLICDEFRCICLIVIGVVIFSMTIWKQRKNNDTIQEKKSRNKREEKTNLKMEKNETERELTQLRRTWTVGRKKTVFESNRKNG